MVNSVCKGKCVHGGIMKIAGMKLDTRSGNRGSFKLGYKRCRKCEYFILYDGIRCPCCNELLKSKPRNNTSRRNLREYNEKLCKTV